MSRAVNNLTPTKAKEALDVKRVNNRTPNYYRMSASERRAYIAAQSNFGSAIAIKPTPEQVKPTSED